MGEFLQSATTKNFINEVQRQIDLGTIANFKDLADKMEWDKTAISNVMNGRRDIPHHRYIKFTEIFKIERPTDAGFRDKYYQLLEERMKEYERLERDIRELHLANKHLRTHVEQLTRNLDQLSHSLNVGMAMQTAYQEWVIEHTSGAGAGTGRKVMNEIRKKAVSFLTSFETNGIGVDMGIVAEQDGK